MSTKDLKRELGKKELLGIAIGQVIGAGVMVLVGHGISMTGKSVNLAFILSAVWVIILCIPRILISSCVRLRGGEYTQAAVLCGEKFAGFFVVVYLLQNMQMAVYSLAFSSYFLSLFPHMNGTLVAILIATFFFIINIFPTKFISSIQNIIVIVLCVAVAVFIVIGMPKVNYADYFTTDFITNGATGLLSASAFLTFSTFGANSIIQLSGECKNPKKDIPFVIIVATLFVAVIYALVGTVAAGVLPIGEVAGENLSKVADYILSKPLYLFFIVGGALGAIMTSLNATIAWVTKPIVQAAEDGWFPKRFSVLHPKYKTPVYVIALYYMVTIIPIVLKIDMDMITQTVLVCMYVCMMVTAVATIRLPKVFPEQWKKSPFHCSNGVLTFLCIAATSVLAIQVYFNASNLSMEMLIANVVLIGVSVIYALLRYRTGKVKMDISYEDS